MERKKSTSAEGKRPIDILKESVGGVSKELLDSYKEQNRIKRMIKKALRSGPKTVPELSAELNLATNIIFFHLMAMRKYGEVADAEEKGSYVSYALSKKEEKSE